MIRCTPRELCALAGCFSKDKVDYYWEKNKWPVPMAIHFRRLEEQINRIKFKHETDDGPGIEDIELARVFESCSKNDLEGLFERMPQMKPHKPI